MLKDTSCIYFSSPTIFSSFWTWLCPILFNDLRKKENKMNNVSWEERKYENFSSTCKKKPQSFSRLWLRCFVIFPLKYLFKNSNMNRRTAELCNGNVRTSHSLEMTDVHFSLRRLFMFSSVIVRARCFLQIMTGIAY